MATTPREIITGALRLINVVQANEAPSPDDISVALTAFDAMIDSWSNDKLMIYTINPTTFQLVGGQATYLIGPTVTNDWVITRPMNIEQMYVRLNGGTPQLVDLPVSGLNDAEFASIAVKNTPSSFPFYYYDNGNYPDRTITFWPVPTVGYDIVLWLHQPLVDFSNLDVTVQYPPGYERAFRFNLACELAAEWGKDIPDRVQETADEAKKELARMNAVPQYMNGDGGLNASRRTWTYITGGFISGSRV